MNSILESLHQRKSVRAFTEQAISQQDKEKILLAATAAPSAGNQQMYTILDITDPALKERLAITCDNQPFIAKAPIVLIFCADYQKWYDAFLHSGCEPRKPAASEFILSILDATIAAQNAVVAAESIGIGSCYIGDIFEHCEEHRSLLQLPQYVVPAVMLVLGYPTPQQKDRSKPQRCNLNHIVHTNHYRHMDAQELQTMLEHNAGRKGYKDWIQAFCKRKYHSAFSLEMARSIEQYWKAFDHETR